MINRPHLNIKLDAGLLAKLNSARRETKRTMTKEVVDRLMQSFTEEEHKILVEALSQKLSEGLRLKLDQLKKSSI